jgi:peptidoglycan/LPS O-acetylase OafA/YrhL
MPSPAKNPYLPSLTGLRFIAAFLVLILHLTLNLQAPTLFGVTVRFASFGSLGMQLFFVLSGFVIHYNYAATFQREAAWQASKLFLFARFSRIYPLFFCALMFALFHDYMLLDWARHDQEKVLTIAYLTGVFSWIPLYWNNHLLAQHTFGYAWSISTEFFFYLIYPFFARAICNLQSPKQVWSFFAIVVVVGYVIQIPGSLQETERSLQEIFGAGHARKIDYLNSHYRWLFYISPYSRVFEFLLGCAAAQIFMASRHSLRSKFFTVTASLFIGACIVGMVILSMAVSSAFLPNWPQVPEELPWSIRYFFHIGMNFRVAPLLALFMLTLSLHDTYRANRINILSSRYFVFLGEISLSLYLLHPIAIRLVPIAPGVPYLAFRIIVAIFFSIALAVGTYQLIEVPARRWIRQWLGVPLPSPEWATQASFHQPRTYP